MRIDTNLDRYRVAAAELPRSFPKSGGVDRTIIVVSGDQWWETALTSLRADPAALVITDPVGMPSETQWQHLEKKLVGVAVACDRMLVPHEAVEKMRAAHESQDLAEGAVAITVEVTSSPAQARAALPAALGWAREMAQSELTIAERSMRGASTQALLLARGSELPISVRMVTGGRRRGAQIRATLLGPTRIEMSVDTATEDVRLAVEDRRGRTLLPPAYESRARAALRRSAVGGDGIAELGSLYRDHALASEFSRS